MLAQQTHLAVSSSLSLIEDPAFTVEHYPLLPFQTEKLTSFHYLIKDNFFFCVCEPRSKGSGFAIVLVHMLTSEN